MRLAGAVSASPKRLHLVKIVVYQTDRHRSAIPLCLKPLWE